MTQVSRDAASPAADAAPWERVRRQEPAAETVTHRMRERLAERERTRRKRVAVRASRYAVIAVVVVGLVWLVLRSPVFALDVDNIETSGGEAPIDMAAVATILEGHGGESLVTLNVPHIADQLRDLPAVRDAVVERVWPAGLRVTLTSRDLVAAIPAPSGGFALVDADAVEVTRVDAEPADLPVVDVPLGADNERILAAVLEAIRHVPQEVRGDVARAGAQTEDSVTFVLRDGLTVEWGSAEDSALKASVLETMLVAGLADSVTVIDVSAPTFPITRED